MLRKSAVKKTLAYIKKADATTKQIASSFASQDSSFSKKGALSQLAESESALKKIYVAVKALVSSRNGLVKASSEKNGDVENILTSISAIATRIDVLASAINAEEFEEELTEEEIEDLSVEDVLEEFNGEDSEFEVNAEDDSDEDDSYEDDDSDEDDIEFDINTEEDSYEDDSYEDEDSDEDDIELEASKKKTLSKKKIVAKKVVSSQSNKGVSGLFSFIQK